MDRLSQIRHSVLLRDLDETSLELLSNSARETRLTKGQTLFLQGDHVEALHLVLSGLVKVYRLDPRSGRQLVLHLEGANRVVDVEAAFAESGFYPFSAEALEDSRLLIIGLEQFWGLLNTRPAAGRAVFRYLVRQQTHLMNLLERMVFQPIEARLAAYLLEQLEQHGQGFALPTNLELAAVLGSVPEPVSRKLGQFYRQGWIDLKRRRVWVLEFEALQALS